MGNAEYINIGVVPYGSFGISWQSMAFSELPVGGLPEPLTYDTSETRFELGFGADLRIEIARRLALSLGAGWRWWNSAEITGNGTIAIPGGDVTYRRSEIYGRAGVAITF
jgi:hypothetical protein